jgi:hypothetical protein
MPFTIDSIKAKPTAAPKRNAPVRPKRDLGPNPWLDKTWDTGLWASYNDDQAYAADFPGALEMLPAKRGANKGELIEKVTGEASDAVVLIREAAEKLGIGVSIRTAKARNGFVRVTWYGKTRKNYAKTPADVASSAPKTE